MFLGELLENEKRLFWELANYLVLADGKIADGEVEMLEAYKEELGKKDYIIEKSSYSAKELILENNLDLRKKKIIFFELLGLAFADNKYVDSEKKVLNEVKQAFNISDEDEREMLEIIQKIMDSYLNLGRILNE